MVESGILVTGSDKYEIDYPEATVSKPYQNKIQNLEETNNWDPPFL